MPANSEFYAEQAQLLDQGVSANPLLLEHAVPSLSRKLGTVEKNSIIRSINEIVSELKSTSDTVSTFLTQVKPILGDWEANQSLKSDMQSIGANLMACMRVFHDRFDEYHTSAQVDTILSTIAASFPTVTVLPLDATVGQAFILNSNGNRSACFCVDVVGGTAMYAKFDLTPI